MDGGRIIEAVLEEIKTNLDKNVKDLVCEISPENLTKIGELLLVAASRGVAVGIKECVEQEDSVKQVIQHNGQAMRRKAKKVDKDFLTIGGEITIARNVYQADSGGACYVPLDHAIGTVGQYALPDVREAIAYMSSCLIPCEVSQVAKRFAMFHPSEKAIRTVLGDIGNWLESNEDNALTLVAQSEEKIPDAEVMVVGMDGANVLLREPGKKKGRPAERPISDGGSDEMKSCYKNAMVGTISFYTIKTGFKDGKPVTEPERMHSIYTARMPEERFPTFKSKLEREVRSAESRLAPEATKIVLMDGARGLWKYVENNPLFSGYEMLLDFYHMTEHLSRLSESLFGKGKAVAQKWYQQYRDKIKHNPTGVVAMLRSVKYHQGKLKEKKLSKSRRECIRRECTFFQNNQQRMAYARFLENAWPIGSGPTESGCKTLVKQRLCRSGMRWTRQGGQKVLSLRSIVKSNRWDALWKQYVAQLTPCAT